MRSTNIRLNKFFFALTLMFGVFVTTTNAQTVTCGTGTTSSYTSPFYCLYNNSWHEMIYQPSELGAIAGCSITKIAFQCASPSNTMSLSGLRIYMGTRPTATHESTSDWTPAGSLQLVYNHGTTTIGGVDGWHTFTLDTPFAYDGEENLVVVVAKTAGSGWTSSVTYYYSEVSGSQYPGLYRGNDSDGTYGTTHPGSSTGTQYGYRANTRFTYANCCSVQRTGAYEFRDASNNVVTYIDYIIGSPFSAPTLVNNLTPAGTPTYSSSNPDVVEVNATTGALTFHDVEGTAVITAYVAGSGSTCPKSVSYTINSGDGCRRIGSGTSTQGTNPLYGSYKQSYAQMIYTAEEIGTPGLITAIGVNSYSTNSVARVIDIYIGETSASTFASTSDWVPASNLQLVYSGTWNIAAGWNVFQLTEPYTYSGLNNLVVAVDCGATSTAYTSFYYTTTTGSTVLYAYSDTYDAIPATISSYSGTKYTTTSRANLKVCIEPCDTRPVNFGFSNSIAMCYLGGQPTITLNRDGNNGVLVWTSSDPSVATVDENGVITTHSLGTTTISVFAPIDGDVCSARASYELEVICPAAIPSAQSVWVCDPQAVDLTATVRDDEGNLELRWFDDVLADTYINTGGTYHTNATATTTYYVAAYNTEQQCYSSRVPSTVHVFDVQYDATSSNVNGYVGVPMYGYAPDGSHEGSTFTASNNMPAWMTLNSDGSFSGTPTAAGSGSFTITATNSIGCTITRTIYWTVTANNLGCCDFESFYLYQDDKPFPLHLADDGYYYADVCLNTAMTLRVQRLNTCSGNYTYTWRLTSSTGGLIQEFTGSQFTYTYDRTAGYGVMLLVKRNNNDCISIPVRVRVAGVFQVATRPSFNLCHGEPFNIYVSTDGVGAIDVIRPSGGAATTLGVSDTILLPDGEPCDGNCFYRSSVTFSDFSAGATIRNANDLLYVLLNIEHTFIGDIYIAITCPSGRRSVILSQCGSGSATCHAQIPSGYDTWVTNVGTSNHGANFGNPNSGNSSSCDPNASGNELGIGWNYIWSENTSRGYTYAGGTGLIYDDANVHNSTVDSSDLANMSQIYVPQETFNNLIGCPLNGTWSIEVVDGWGGDNGHIFNWELGLNEELLPDSWSYTVDLDSSWVTCGWNSTKSGVYMEITPPDNFNGTESCDLFLRDEYGCTSTYENIVTVTMNPTVHSTEEVSGQCEPYTWARNNQTYTTSGTYVDAGLTPAGCPDTATLVLSISGSVSETVNAQACESYTWSANGQTYTQSGTYTANLTTAMGCDSIITLNLTISNEITVPHDTVICPDNFPLNDWYGDWGDFAAAGSLQQHFTTANGCDSLVVLTVQAYPKPDVSLPPPPGAGGCPLTAGSYVITPTITNARAPYSYNWTGDYVGATPTASIPASVTCGTFTETLYFTDANGCMDTATVTFSAVDDVAPYFLNDMPDYSEVSAVAMGQDCRFRIPDIVGILQPADNCGVSEMVQLPLPLNDITEPTTVEVIVTDRCGLQTRRYITVTVPDPLSANELAHTNVSCAGRSDGTVTLSGVTGGSPQYHYSWSSSGTGATNVSSQAGTTLSNLAPGIYTVTITDDAECSIQKSVTVGIDGEASTNVESFTACDSFTWHGTTYTQSNNTATYTTTNAEGCDSTVTLNLTVNHSSSGIDSHTECDSYTWPMNSQTYTSSTSSPSVPAGLNAAGCDSTVTLHLTINRSTTGTDVHTACDSYTWPLNGQTYTSSTNSPQVVITNRAGCDSTVTLRLTINNTRYGSYVDTVCYGEQLTYRGNRYPAGQHTVTITSAAGCDSVVALQVVARPQLSVNIEEYHSCELGHYQLTGSVSGSNNVSYRWTAHPSDPDVEIQRDDLEISVNPSRSTDYTLTAGYGAGRICAASQTISLSPLRLPVADITFNPPFLTCDDLEWTAHSASQNAESISWYVNDIEAGIDETISGAAQCDDDSVRISIVAVNSICTDVHDTVIYLRKSQLWFPNVFTPNLNINKTFAPIGHGIVEYEIYIYTREGLLVFHSTTLEEGWRGDHNGVECPRATYTYIARFRNEIEPDVWHKQIGTVTLLR